MLCVVMFSVVVTCDHFLPGQWRRETSPLSAVSEGRWDHSVTGLYRDWRKDIVAPISSNAFTITLVAYGWLLRQDQTTQDTVAPSGISAFETMSTEVIFCFMWPDINSDFGVWSVFLNRVYIIVQKNKPLACVYIPLTIIVSFKHFLTDFRTFVRIIFNALLFTNLKQNLDFLYKKHLIALVKALEITQKQIWQQDDWVMMVM